MSYCASTPCAASKTQPFQAASQGRILRSASAEAALSPHQHGLGSRAGSDVSMVMGLAPMPEPAALGLFPVTSGRLSPLPPLVPQQQQQQPPPLAPVGRAMSDGRLAAAIAPALAALATEVTHTTAALPHDAWG
jgi:hypothetical protein